MKINNIKKTLFLFLLCLFLFIIYSNSFNSEFFFDDFVNIVNNPNVHLIDLSLDNIKRCFFGRTFSTFDRPLAFLTFGINYYFGKLDPFGYHIVNYFIHLITSIFLFLVIFDTAMLFLKNNKKNRAFFVAAVSTLFWAANSIHVLAVTFIVQRMASLAGMFYIITLFLYIRGRCLNGRKKYFLYTCSFFSWFLGMCTKETVFPSIFMILIYDLFFFQRLNRKDVINFLKTLGVILLMLLVPLFLLLKFHQYPFMKAYAYKTFTLWERLLTEPRVFLFYLSLIFFPHSSRLTVIHDFSISKSLLDPLSTLFSIIILILILILCLYKAKKHPLIVFSILFYFINHLMEGTFICLDLVYEYRNYIPAMFIYVPIAMILCKMYNTKNHTILYKIIVISVIMLYSLFEGVQTYALNNSYQTEFSLWTDNAKKSPTLFTPHYNLAYKYFKQNKIKESIKEIVKARKSKPDIAIGVKSSADFLLGLIYSSISKYDEAIKFFYKSLSISPENAEVYKELAIAYGEKGLFKKAYESIKKALQIQDISQELQTSDQYAFTYCNLLLAENKIENAEYEIQKNLLKYKDSMNLHYLLAECFRKQNKYQSAKKEYKYILKADSNCHKIRLDLITLYIELNENNLLNEQIKLLPKDSLSVINNYIRNNNETKKAMAIKKIFKRTNQA